MWMPLNPPVKFVSLVHQKYAWVTQAHFGVNIAMFQQNVCPCVILGLKKKRTWDTNDLKMRGYWEHILDVKHLLFYFYFLKKLLVGVFVIFEHFWGKNHSQNDSAFGGKKQFLIRTCIFWYCDSQLKQLVLRFMICFLDPKAGVSPCSRLFERIFTSWTERSFSMNTRGLLLSNTHKSVLLSTSPLPRKSIHVTRVWPIKISRGAGVSRTAHW